MGDGVFGACRLLFWKEFGPELLCVMFFLERSRAKRDSLGRKPSTQVLCKISHVCSPCSRTNMYLYLESC